MSTEPDFAAVPRKKISSPKSFKNLYGTPSRLSDVVAWSGQCDWSPDHSFQTITSVDQLFSHKSYPASQLPRPVGKSSENVDVIAAHCEMRVVVPTARPPTS